MCDDINADDDAIATQHTGTRIDCDDMVRSWYPSFLFSPISLFSEK
jgi:hypothetical protein